MELLFAKINGLIDDAYLYVDFLRTFFQHPLIFLKIYVFGSTTV